MRAFTLLFVLMLSATARSGSAQSKLYLDLRAGINRNEAEGVYFGKSKSPFKAYNTFGQSTFAVQGVPMLRLQLNEKFGIATGYSGGSLSWSYNIKVPKEYTVNSSEGDYYGKTIGVYMHQFPLLLSKTFKEYHFWEIDTVQHIHRVSIRLDAVLGGGLNRFGNSLLDGDYGGTGFGEDLIEFRATPVLRRKWGQFLIGGVTARFYHRDRERLSLSVYYTQGLTDMLHVPVEYRYNTQSGSTKLRVRGSGLSATLSYPLRLATFGRQVPAVPRPQLQEVAAQQPSPQAPRVPVRAATTGPQAAARPTASDTAAVRGYRRALYLGGHSAEYGGGGHYAGLAYERLLSRRVSVRFGIGGVYRDGTQYTMIQDPITNRYERVVLYTASYTSALLTSQLRYFVYPGRKVGAGMFVGAGLQLVAESFQADSRAPFGPVSGIQLHVPLSTRVGYQLRRNRWLLSGSTGLDFTRQEGTGNMARPRKGGQDVHVTTGSDMQIGFLF